MDSVQEAFTAMIDLSADWTVHIQMFQILHNPPMIAETFFLKKLGGYQSF